MNDKGRKERLMKSMEKRESVVETKERNEMSIVRK
jgi:hypothetical protein